MVTVRIIEVVKELPNGDIITSYDKSGQELTAKDASITYVKVAGDLGEITTVNSSYSWSMKFPKTINNTMVLDGLGMVASGSSAPYDKIYVTLLEDGAPIVAKGILNITETSDEYKIHINEGTVDFLEDLKDATVGENIDLLDFNHERKWDNIVTSNTGSPEMVYPLADINGRYWHNEKVRYPSGHVSTYENFHSDYMIPYISCKAIWDRIFKKYGWKAVMDKKIDDSLKATYMSYPDEIKRVKEINSSFHVLNGSLRADNFPYEVGDKVTNLKRYAKVHVGSINDNYIKNHHNNGDNKFTFPRYGTYRISLNASAQVLLESITVGGKNVSIQVPWRLYTTGRYLTDYIGGESSEGVRLDTHHEVELEFIKNEDLRIEFDIEEALNRYNDNRDGRGVESTQIVRGSNNLHYSQTALKLDVYFLSGGYVDWSKALSKLKIKDFFKEFMVREGLTAFTDNYSKTITFKTLDQRLTAGSIDWSSKYSKRKSETYLYRNYAKKNYLRHKYNDKDARYNDGVLKVNNRNIDDDKTVYTSFGYSAEQGKVKINTKVGDTDRLLSMNKLPVYNLDIKTDEKTGNKIGTYKHQKDRYIITKMLDRPLFTYVDGIRTRMKWIVDFDSASFINIVNTTYNNFDYLTHNAKVHKIELKLSLADIIALDLKETYYFEQELGYYILNKLTYKSGQLTTGEFIRINSSIQVTAHKKEVLKPSEVFEEATKPVILKTPVPKYYAPPPPVTNTPKELETNKVEAPTTPVAPVVEAPEKVTKEAEAPETKPKPVATPKVEPVAPKPKPVVEPPKPTAPVIVDHAKPDPPSPDRTTTGVGVNDDRGLSNVGSQEDSSNGDPASIREIIR